MVEKGIVYGRFQILHFKHLEYFLAAKMRCRKLYIGIMVPDSSYLEEEEPMSELERDPWKEPKTVDYRVRKGANPLTYIERYEMVRDAILSFGVPREEFEIVPFPLEKPELLREYVPGDATCFLSICDDWTRKNQEKLEELGFQTEVLWNRNPEEKGTTGTQVRQRILAGEKWSDLVPRTVYEYILAHGIDDRIKYTK
ncbi:hypothetical protein K280104A7_25230 [Candidatus Bariatricus faecipullorum]